ncbi:ABC transporter permease [Paenibacillus oenotherae]|uniref:ABC transporter permease n=1 Tax=Paenibacillus oenotherae TaxID=1435645 RepID=A0ABS7DB16_9BACL|nr:ABC transporter permease [Paenibacillus oenotherae]MBW7477138.1 ABC transporter permease [Paenibacillus oenotherae]
MDNLIQSELFKLRKNRSFWTLIFIIMGLAAAFVVLSYIDSRMDQEAEVKGIDYFMNTIIGNNYMIKFSLPILAGFFIASEYSTGVMKTIASSGNSRLRIYMAKLFVLSFGGIVISLVLPFTLLTIGTLLSGFGELPDGSSLAYVLRVTGLTFLYAIAFASIVAVFSTIFAESGKTIGMGLVFFMFIDTILFLLGNFAPFVRTIDDNMVFKLSQEIDALNMDNGMLFKLIAVPVITYIVLGSLGAWIYTKKEIK